MDSLHYVRYRRLGLAPDLLTGPLFSTILSSPSTSLLYSDSDDCGHLNIYGSRILQCWSGIKAMAVKPIHISAAGDYVQRGNEGDGWFVVDVRLSIDQESSSRYNKPLAELYPLLGSSLLPPRNDHSRTEYPNLSFISVTIFDGGEDRGPKIVWNDREEEGHRDSVSENLSYVVSESRKLNNVWRGNEARASEMVWKEER
ncbi:hypothetical protein D9757_009866 [Collybiopsis confluens]|uniref:Uncharacterized protein n=1 Tax=Collybiopsis confluens TaxID=2823264 RepID=A0A8H5H6T2_9AGAR|nr:hypothetical protein D9757_009866 [Collybiopsis confluens]